MNLQPHEIEQMARTLAEADGNDPDRLMFQVQVDAPSLIELDDQAWDTLNAILADPPPANDALKAACRSASLWDRT